MSTPHRSVSDSLPVPDHATEISDGIYAYIQPDGSWWINNTGFLVGRRRVVSVDTCSTVRRTHAYLQAIAEITDQPIRTLINTHHHGDHTFGNFLFNESTIVAHEATRELVLATGLPESDPYWTRVDWGDVNLEPPFLTYTEGVTVHVDDLACQVVYVGTPAHTTNDSIVWVPERKVLFSGDLLFNGGTPFLVQGSIRGARIALQHLRMLNAETIVPGHGSVCGPEVIDQVDAYLAFVQETAQAGSDAGLSPLDTARQIDLGEFADLLDSERIVGNLHRAFAEIDGYEPGAAINVAAALADMVSYNGGRPLTCLA